MCGDRNHSSVNIFVSPFEKDTLMTGALFLIFIYYIIRKILMSAPHSMLDAMWNERNQSAKEAAKSHELIFRLLYAQHTVTMTFEPFILQWLISKTTKIFGCRRSRNHYLKVEINQRIYFTICCFSQFCQNVRRSERPSP